ncbi:uncharacterized protein LOC116737399 [Xiphophorus hellerii]|uniref:uncharacterized protein LOC116737399 n=1 Tax=Xiphophorus hellerii TaxID=8084 RepID=UPI0013B40427|nr:uncharacterized protein LOC116737399 [Xiphophorus hellerii]
MEDQDRAEPPGPISPSMRSDRSKGRPPYFSNEPGPSDRKRSFGEEEHPSCCALGQNVLMDPVCTSCPQYGKRPRTGSGLMTANQSSCAPGQLLEPDHWTDWFWFLSPNIQKMKDQDRAEPPGPISPSMRSDRSKDLPPCFSNEPGPSDRKRSFGEEEHPSCCGLGQNVLMDPVCTSCPQYGKRPRTGPERLTANQSSCAPGETEHLQSELPSIVSVEPDPRL